MAIFLKGNDVSTFANDVKNTSEPNSKFPGYQEGRWTPTFGSNVTNTEVLGASALQCWSRIGNTVFLSGRMSFNSTETDSIKIYGRPYDPLKRPDGGIASEFCGPVMTQHFGTANIPIVIFQSALEMLLYKSTNTAGFTKITYDDFNATSASIIFTITYQTDDTTWQPINGATLV